MMARNGGELSLRQRVVAIITAGGLSFMINATGAGAEDSYLKAGDEIVCVGDSITAAGLYQGYVQETLKALYPLAAIQLVNLGRGGQSAGGGTGDLGGYLRAHKPALVLFMFGVNDTGWSDADPENKIKTFVGALQQAADATKAQGVPLILLKESHFSHGKDPAADAYENKVNHMLDQLFAAQAAFAAEKGIPVIDVNGAYKRALAAAWAKDPAYEFTPDIVHPSSPGHSAMAGEILRAFGAGLPLAAGDGQRGLLRREQSPDLVLTLADAGGVAKPDATLVLTVTLRNQKDKPEKGTLVLCVAGQKLEKAVAAPAKGTVNVAFDLPVTALKARWGADLVYMAFIGKNAFAADNGFFFHSRIQPAESRDAEFPAADFQGFLLEGRDARTCTVSRVSVRRTGDEFTFRFDWNDRTVVAAQPGFKNRFGQEIKTPLDLNSREGQPCDAVEFFLDLRSPEAIGRWTANIDANPDGVQRLGVYREMVEGKPVAKVQSLPELPADRISLASAGENRWVLKVRAPVAGPCVGFTMRVTDNTEFKYAGTPLFYLGGCAGAGPEPMRYFQLGSKDEGVLYRIGY